MRASLTHYDEPGGYLAKPRSKTTQRTDTKSVRIDKIRAALEIVGAALEPLSKRERDRVIGAARSLYGDSDW